MFLLRTTRILAVALAPALIIQCARGAVAQAEPVLISIEGQAALALTAPQSKLFGPGATGALAIQYPLTPMFLIGLRLRAGFLTNGDPPAERGLRDPGTGTFELGMATLRLRPFASGSDVRRATGLFLEVGGGGGVTGEVGRAAFEGGLGYGIPLGGLAIAPTLRYLQVLQPTTVLSSADARLLMLGIELTFNDARATSLAGSTPDVPRDQDHDGIDDLSDKCPELAEDLDGHADVDGCPDFDNDGDGILDVKDKCPNDAEDFDEYEDGDGCPEPDNDNDGFADADDQCPNEAEVVNGNTDFDGCPDEGLIVFENNRIVLEERVLFDFERARIRREARPLLKAILTLKAQHPDWVALRIEGHADARGDAGFNQELSERRARHVMEELIRLGLPASEIHSLGFGATRLRDKRDEEEAHQRNRRVEFVVESKPLAPSPKAADAVVPSELAPPPELDGAVDEPPATKQAAPPPPPPTAAPAPPGKRAAPPAPPPAAPAPPAAAKPASTKAAAPAAAGKEAQKP
jgi:outer membrane protein OmpA-like peptidoglycan-associated protein